MRPVVAALAALIIISCGEKRSSEPVTSSSDTSGTTSTNTPPAINADSRPTPTPGQPCSYVTEAEVTEVMGHPMKFGEAKPGECTLVSASGDLTKSASFQIGDGSTLYDAMAGGGGEPVSGLGDKAVVVPVTNIVAAKKGSRNYMGGVYLGPNTADAKTKSIELARKVVPRI